MQDVELILSVSTCHISDLRYSNQATPDSA
jgi:hypothetical protein